MGNDGKIIYWDGDRLRKILTLSGHLSQIYELSISFSGQLIVSSGNDYSIRMWELTDDPILLEDTISDKNKLKIDNYKINKKSNFYPHESGEKICLILQMIIWEFIR